MKNQFITLFLILFSVCVSEETTAQADYTVRFDTCDILNRVHIDSSYSYDRMFAGDGVFKFYRDSVIGIFANEWESGKYHFDLVNLNGETNSNDFVWEYRGVDRYRGEYWVIMLVVDQSDQPTHLEVFSNYTKTEEENWSLTHRVYTLKK